LITILQQELNELCNTLEARQCRHVRCLRPNDDQKPLDFDDDSMLRQCRYSGLLEATRIRKQGFAHRRPLAAFADRYALLLPSPQARRAARHNKDESKGFCQAIVEVAQNAGVSSEDLQIGHTKAFLRAEALDRLETMRFHAAAAMVAASLSAYRTRSCFLRMRSAAIALQAFARGCAGRRAAIIERELLKVRLAALEAERAARALAEAAAFEKAAREAAYQEASQAATKLQQCWRKRQSTARAIRLARWQQERQQELQQERQQRQHQEEAQAQAQEEQKKNATKVQPSMQLPVAAVARGPVEEDVAKLPVAAVARGPVEEDVAKLPVAAVARGPVEEDVAKAMMSPAMLLRTVTPSRRHVGEIQVCERNTLSISTRPLQAHELLDMSSSNVQAQMRRDETPRAMHRHCLHECTQLLAQNQRLQKLPRDQQLAVAELAQTSEFLTSNSAHKIEEHLVSVRDRIHHIKACLRVPVAVAASVEPTTVYRPVAVAVPEGIASRPEMTRSASAFSVRSTMPNQSPRTSFRSPLKTGLGSGSRSISLQRASVGVHSSSRSCSLQRSSVGAGLTPVRATVGAASSTAVAQKTSMSYAPAATVVAGPPTAVMPVQAPQWAWQHAATPVARAEKALKVPAEKKAAVQQVATPSRMRSPSKVAPATPSAYPRHNSGHCTPQRPALGSPPPRTNSFAPPPIMGLATPKSVRGTSVGRSNPAALTPYRGRGNFKSSPGRCHSP